MAKAKKFFKEASELALVKAEQALAMLKEQERRKEEEEWAAFEARLQKDPFSTLDTLLILALTEKFHGKIGPTGKPKQFLNRVWALKDRVKVPVVATILDPLYKAPFPFKMLANMAENYIQLDSATEEFLAGGYHGLMIYDQTIYPVKLFVEDKETRDWGIKSEAQIMRMVAHVACVAFNLPAIQCHVMLFSQCEFSHRMASVAHRVVDIKEAYPDQDEANVVPLIKVVA